MTDVILFVSYFLSSCSGLVLIKYGSMIKDGIMLHIPIINLSLSIFSIMGYACYIASFLLYIVLIGRHELTFLNPFSVGVTSILIFVSAAIFFGEAITVAKVAGLALVLAGVVVINIFK